MKLTSWSDLVKPDRKVLLVAAVTTLVSFLALQLFFSFTDHDRERMDRFGTTTARMLAELAVEPMMKQDRLHLGVISNRLGEIAEVAGVASYTVDNKALANTGDLKGPQYTQPVTIDDSIVGYVRVALLPEAFVETGAARTLSLALVMALVPLVVAAGWSIVAAGRRGELTGLFPGRPSWLAVRWPRATEPEPAEIRLKPQPEAAPDIYHYLLAVNLYNQLSLQPTEREFELSLCIELAESLAALYQGQVVALPGVGALVDFDHTDDDDRPFQILCAAFVLARLLREETPFGTYRVGLNLALRPADQPLPLDDDAVADATLLSALAKDMTLSISAPFAQALGGFDRMSIQPIVNPLLDELMTSNAACYLVTGLQAPFASLVLQQAEQLRTQRESISSESTF